MRFVSTAIDAVKVIEWQPHEDERGSFARITCQREFENEGIDFRVVQSSIAVSRTKGTLRGIHFQKPPYEEGKVFRCIRGKLFAVACDLREGSPTFAQVHSLTLRERGKEQLYVGKGIGLGYLTLADDVEVLYLMNEYYHPTAPSGVRFDDPRLAIAWPHAPVLMSAADKAWPRLAELFPNAGR